MVSLLDLREWRGGGGGGGGLIVVVEGEAVGAPPFKAGTEEEEGGGNGEGKNHAAGYLIEGRVDEFERVVTEAVYTESLISVLRLR